MADAPDWASKLKQNIIDTVYEEIVQKVVKAAFPDEDLSNYKSPKMDEIPKYEAVPEYEKAPGYENEISDYDLEIQELLQKDIKASNIENSDDLPIPGEIDEEQSIPTIVYVILGTVIGFCVIMIIIAVIYRSNVS